MLKTTFERSLNSAGGNLRRGKKKEGKKSSDEEYKGKEEG